MNLSQISQGQTLQVIKPISFHGETKKIRTFNAGQKLWICSSFVYHNKGQIKLAKITQNMGDAVIFNWNDIKDSIGE